MTPINARIDAVYESYRSGGYSLKEIVDYFEIHYSSVSNLVKNLEGENSKPDSGFRLIV